MSTTDEVLGSIDHALTDFETSGDAMRWTPEPAKPPQARGRRGLMVSPEGYIMRSPAAPLPHASINSVFVTFIANSERFRTAMEKLADVLNATGPDIARLVAALKASEQEARSQALWTAYHARRRTRRNRR